MTKIVGGTSVQAKQERKYKNLAKILHWNIKWFEYKIKAKDWQLRQIKQFRNGIGGRISRW